MPNLTFILPHWLYWAVLIALPAISMVIIRRQRGRNLEGRLSYGITYIFWLLGGFAGLHRLYLKNKGVLVYIPLIIGVLLTNVQIKEALNLVSAAKNNVKIAEFDLERAQGKVEKGSASAMAELEKAKKAMKAAEDKLSIQLAEEKKWKWISRILASIIAILLIIDAFLIPGMLRQRIQVERETAMPAAQEYEIPDAEGLTGDTDPSRTVHTPWLDWIDTINGYVGEFVCYWSIIAVFVYYYEVIARYIFNSPTNWAHEGMFLMFGMQYMLAAGYTQRERGHVNVDIIHKHLPDRLKAIVDIFTSSIFFIFTIAILVTGYVFLADSIRVWEVSFTEWGIQYWPVKITIPLGALLITLQGLSKLIKDIIFVFEKRV